MKQRLISEISYKYNQIELLQKQIDELININNSTMLKNEHTKNKIKNKYNLTDDGLNFVLSYKIKYGYRDPVCIQIRDENLIINLDDGYLNLTRSDIYLNDYRSKIVYISPNNEYFNRYNKNELPWYKS